MSDTPPGPDWWQAGDGQWYPTPPGLTDSNASRPPTPPPDHDPEPLATGPTSPFSAGVYRAGRLGADTDDDADADEDTTSHRRRSLGVAIGAALLVVVLVLGTVAAVTDHSTRRASSNDPSYQQAIVDLLGTERTNLVFIQTFWESYQANQVAPSNNARSGRSSGTFTMDTSWFADMQAQVEQFSRDLADIDAALEERPWSNGSVADEVRDLARSHYQTWQRWTNDVPTLVREWLESGSTVELATWLESSAPQLETAIERTFQDLCDALVETAPDDGRFDSTIIAICEQ
jgi:hypothetical protein